MFIRDLISLCAKIWFYKLTIVFSFPVYTCLLYVTVHEKHCKVMDMINKEI